LQIGEFIQVIGREFIPAYWLLFQPTSLFKECNYLDGVEAADDSSVLDLDVRRRVRKATLVVRARASSTNMFTADFERQPARVLPAPSTTTDTAAGRH